MGKRYEIQATVKSEDVELYAWTIEVTTNDKDWFPYLNRKLYATEDVALKAMNSITKYNLNPFRSFRIRPLYTLSNKLYRSYTIDKLLD